MKLTSGRGSYLCARTTCHRWSTPGGPASSQDWGGKVRASVDFIPFKGSSLNTMPADGRPYNNGHDPVTPYWPPDDIFTQCNVQFQVTHVFQFAAPHGDFRWCDADPKVHEFATNTGVRDALVSAALGPNAAQLFFGVLDPVFVEIGGLDCTQFFWGKAEIGGRQLQMDFKSPGITLAHELGHVLGLDHIAPEGNLMAEPAVETALTAAQCVKVRQKAASLSSSFRQYNQAVGRLPNPAFASVPEAHEGDPHEVSVGPEVCCTFEDYRFIGATNECILSGGNNEPRSKCTECCYLGGDQVEVRELGSCDEGVVFESQQCETVCCQTANGSYEYSTYFGCFANLGVPISDWTLCGVSPPR